MDLFYFGLIMLTAVLLSQLINHFVPVLSLPLIQIAFGVLIAFIPGDILGMDFVLQPELFFVLFVAPLVFHSARKSDIRTMRRLISPILMAAIGLVIAIVFIGGYFIHFLIPVIPLVAAYAMAAALGPTDVVAVEAVSSRAPMPHRIISILSGESMINDASGVVCFQFAIIAAMTGSFNVFSGLLSFIIVSLGGLVVGIALTTIKFILIRWLRSQHIVNAALHIAIGIMLPFIIYMVAEHLGTSGILAVFASGILHALYPDKYNPEVVTVNNAYENTWSILVFGLEGMVFVILGHQLPHLIRADIGRDLGLSGSMIFLCIFAFFLLLAAMRFGWWAMTVRQKTYSSSAHPVSFMRAGLIFTIAGARGAISMASILSIPLLLSDGIPFPARDLLILLTCGIIIVSLVTANFVLPLLADKGDMSFVNMRELEKAARNEILKTVVRRLKAAATPENHAATEVIIRYYYARMNRRMAIEMKSGKKWRPFRIRRNILIWEKEVVLHLTETGQISETRAEHHFDEMERLYEENSKITGPFRALYWVIMHLHESTTWKEPATLKNGENGAAEQMDDAERAAHALKRDINKLAECGLHMEQELIKEMMAAGRLSPKTAKEMQADIILLEAQIHSEQ